MEWIPIKKKKKNDDMECPGEITDTRQDEHQANVLYSAWKDECVRREKWDKIYILSSGKFCLQNWVTCKN